MKVALAGSERLITESVLGAAGGDAFTVNPRLIRVLIAVLAASRSLSLGNCTLVVIPEATLETADDM